MNIEQQLAELQKKHKEVSKIKKEIQKESENIFNQYCEDIFKSSDLLESFSWSQYTPYFNDGSPCIFSANTDYIKLNGQYVDESDWFQEKNITNYGKWDQKSKTYVGREEVDNPNYNKGLAELADKIRDFLSSFDDDFYVNKFGDHCEITVTKDGISVDEYDHE